MCRIVTGREHHLTLGQRLTTSFGAKPMQVRVLRVRPFLGGECARRTAVLQTARLSAILRLPTKFGPLLPARCPVLQIGAGGGSTRTGHHDAAAARWIVHLITNQGVGSSSLSCRASFAPFAESKPRLLIWVWQGKHLHGAPLWSGLWTAPIPPKDWFPCSNHGRIAKCACSPTGRGGRLKPGLVKVQILSCAPRRIGWHSGEAGGLLPRVIG